MNYLHLRLAGLFERYEKWLKIAVFLIIVIFSVKHRLQYFRSQGKDIYAYERAISDLITGVNPYKWTAESFSNPDDLGNHGFSYFPGMLYLFTPLYVAHLQTGFPHYILWKIPVLLADIGVGVLLYYVFRKKGTLPLTAALLLWFYNPYSFFRTGYTYTDPITIFFMFLSLILLEKDDVLSGAFYALSIAMKTFPYIIFPVMLLKAQNKRGFLLAALLVGVLISFPFLKNLEGFATYLNGAVLVHQNRFVQGRPFLFYISYFYKVELFQIIPFHIYTLLASFSGWVISSALYFLKIVKDKYILALIPFLTFYLFTPVFNRTYFIWFIPIFSVAVYNLFEHKLKPLFYATLLAFFSFSGWYLVQWEDGFHIWHP